MVTIKNKVTCTNAVPQSRMKTEDDLFQSLTTEDTHLVFFLITKKVRV